MKISTSDGSVKLYKPVEALIMVPRSHKLSPLSRKMYNVLLYVSQTALRNMQGIPPANHLFEASLSDVLKITGAEDQRNKAQGYLTEMRKADVVWDSPDSTSELRHVGFSLLSEYRISKRAREIWIQWALPPSLYEALSDPDRWATIDLLVLSRLKSYAAIVLYELCTKYRDNPSHVTCRKSPAWWIEILSATPIPIDPLTGLRKLRDWRKYKDEFVKNAIVEINSESDLNIELLEDREGGKAVKTVQFKVEIKKKIKALNADDDTNDVSKDITDFVERLGINADQDIKAMAKAHGQNAVLSALHQLDERMKQTHLPLVRSPSGFMRHLLGEKNEIAQELIDVKSPSSVTGIVKPSALKKPPLLSTISVLSDEQVRLSELNNEIIQEILLLSGPDLKSLLKNYSDLMLAKGLLTPTTKRRLDSQDWSSGLIKHGVIDLYASASRGPGWKVADLQRNG